MTVMKLGRLLATQLQRTVTSVPEVVPEVLLDHFPFVTKAKDELLMSIMGIGLHDMPEDWAVTDGNHGLRAEIGFLPEAGAFTTAQNDDFHGSLFLVFFNKQLRLPG